MRDYFDWTREAGCRGFDATLFSDPKNKYDVARARSVCKKVCPVAQDCLLYSIIHEEVGIWGGYTDAERFNIGRKIKPRLIKLARAAGIFHPEFVAGRAD